MANKQIFRQEALDRLQSPEELDQLLVVINRKSWIVIWALCFICAAGIAWSFLGRIPITVDGFGVLINPGNVKGIQSPASGQIASISVRVGEVVTEGQTLAILDQPELVKELEQLQDRRKERVAFHKVAATLDKQRQELETNSYKQQRAFILEEIKESGGISEELYEQSNEFAEEQRRNLTTTKELTSGLNKSLRNRLDTIKTLRFEGLTSQDLVLDAESNLMDSELRAANVDVQFKELELARIQSERSRLEQQNRLSDLKLQLLQLDIASQRLEQELLNNRENRENELGELDNQIARIELRLKRQGQIVSDCNGRILEITVQPAQVVSTGMRIGTIERDDPDAELTNLAYFSIKDGKRIKAGARARVTPSTVQREREGSIVGTVSNVSAFPITQEGIVNIVGSPEIAQSLIQQGGAIEVEVELERDADSFSGFKWTSKGPEIGFTAGTTTAVSITIEQRTPITYLLPILRGWFLGEQDAAAPDI